MYDKIVGSGWHWQYGWMRRSDEDCEQGYCYEQPDGDLVFSARADHRFIMRLDCRIDSKTGEKYLCLNNHPTRKFAPPKYLWRMMTRRR